MIALPLWAKIVGPIIALALLIAAVVAWGNSKYRAGHDDGVTETDAKWIAASEKLKADAAKSATQADDRAAERLAYYIADANADAAAVEKAKAEGTSPLDALFGGN